MASFKNIPLGTPEKFNVVLEIPKNSPIKYEYDHNTDKFIKDFIFKNGFVYKYNYGFIPQTLAEDGDTLDVLVLSEQEIATGTVIQAQAIGMIEMLDRRQSDNKILAVPVGEKSKLKSVGDLTPQQLQEFRDFFAEIARQKNKTIIINGFLDKDLAIAEIRRCQLKFQQ